MKILVEKAPDYCGPHSLERSNVRAQIVIFDPCMDCNPTRSDFVGIEDNAIVGEAVVMERPDFDRQSYELTVREALRTVLEEDDEVFLTEVAHAMANQLLEIADEYDAGSVVTRLFGQYDVFHHKRAS